MPRQVQGAGKICGDNGGWHGDSPASRLYSTSALHIGTLGEDQGEWASSLPRSHGWEERGDFSPPLSGPKPWLLAMAELRPAGPAFASDEGWMSPGLLLGLASLKDLVHVNLR